MFFIIFCIFVSMIYIPLNDTCPLEYRIIDPNHSFCSKSFPNVIDQRVTLLEQKYILDTHNHERQLTRGINMEKMYWNNELANIALYHARTCLFEHDKISQRSVPKIPLSTGQNIAMGYENWTEVLEGWIEEKEHYYHWLPSTTIFSHYTQMIWHSSVLIGCAATICPPFGPYNIPWRFHVCNYITGIMNSNYHAAYEQGDDNRPLRDCHGKVCLYNGTLSLNTCECQCSNYASGIECEHLDCSKLPPCPYHSSISCIAADVPLECPHLCGLCDRYEILKNIHGKEYLAPMITTTETSTIKIKSTSQEIPERFRTSTSSIFIQRNITNNLSNISSSFFISICIFIIYLLHNLILIYDHPS